MRDFNKTRANFDGSKGNQKHQVSKAFFERPKTRTMIEYETGVPLKNIDRYIAQLLKVGVLFVAKQGICEITKAPGVIYYSNNPEYYPKDLPIQLKMY